MPEEGLTARIQGGHDNVRGKQVLLYPDVPKERTIGNYRYRKGSQGFYAPNDISKAAVQGGFACPRDRDKVGKNTFRKKLRKFRQDFLYRNIFFPFRGPVGGPALFAINAVIGAGLKRYDVDTE